MAYGGGGGGQQQTDQTANFFWMISLICGVIIATWFLKREWIVIPVFYIRDLEIDFVEWLSIVWVPVAKFFHLPIPDVARLEALQVYIQSADPARVSWRTFSSINAEFGDWVRYPVIAVLLLLGGFSFFRRSGQFRHTYTMKTLRVVGEEVWPQITPITSLDLVKEDIDTGPWAMAVPPLHFARHHELLSTKQVAHKKIWTLKEKPAYRLFVMQLGSLWKGLDHLPIHAKALAYIFLCRATGKRSEAMDLLKHIAASASTGKLDFTGISEKLKSFHNHNILQWLEKRHAYTTTLLATLLEIARSDGVLASAEFLWLKPVDRRLWFVLNSVGRRTAVVEVAGVFSHWKAEKKVGRALKTPMVKAAVDSLGEALQTILVIEEGDQWRADNEA
jgi:intracellular multiplication protein IcmP